MRNFLLSFILVVQWTYAGGMVEELESDLKGFNKSISLSYPSSYYEPLGLSLEDKRTIKQLDELQTFYLEIFNKYLSRYNRNQEIEPYSFTAKELKEIHYELHLKTLESLGKYNKLDLDKEALLTKLEKQSTVFSENFISRAENYAQKGESSSQASKVDIKKIIEKVKFKFKHSPISKTGIRIRSRMKGRVVALTFMITLIATNVLPATFTLLGQPKLALIFAAAIQPALKQLIVTTYFKIKNNSKLKRFLGEDNYLRFRNFVKYLYKDKPLMKSIKIIESDQYFKFRYRSPKSIKNIISYFTGKNHINFSEIKKYSLSNNVYSQLLRESEKISKNDYDKTLYFILEVFKRKDQPESIRFFNRFEKTFLRTHQYVDNFNELNEWLLRILAINDFISFEKALRNPPKDIPTIVYFEILKNKILPTFAAYEEVKYKDFRFLVNNLYEKELSLLRKGNNTLQQKEINELADTILNEAKHSQECPSWLNKNLPQFKFLKGIIF